MEGSGLIEERRSETEDRSRRQVRGRGSLWPRHVPRGLVYVLVLLLYLMLFATAGMGERLAVEVLTEDDGLPSTEVLSMTTGPDDRLWFSTRIGIGVFDGVDWQSFGYADGLPAPTIHRLHVGADGRAWGLTRAPDAVIAYFDGERWTGQAPRPEGGFEVPMDLGILESSRSAGSHGEPMPVILDEHGNLQRWDGETWRQDEVLSSAGERGRQLARSVDGSFLWLAADHLYRVEGEGTERVGRLPESLPGPIHGLTEREGELWAAGSDWLAHVEPDPESLDLHVRKSFSLSIPAGTATEMSAEPSTLRLSPDGHGGWVVASTDRVRHVAADGKVSVWGRAEGLADDGAFDAGLDPDGFLWLVSRRGVSRIRSLAMQGWTGEGLFDNEVSSLLELGDGTLLLGHEGGLTWMGEDGLRRESIRGPDGGFPRIMDMVEGHGGIWLAARQVGLVHRSGGRDQWFSGDGLPGPYVSALVEADGILWVGGKQGVFRFEGDRQPDGTVAGRWTLEPGPAPVRRLARASDGRMAAATARGGLWLKDSPEAVWRRIPGVSALGSEPEIYTVWIDDGSERIWAGCTDGLYEVVDDHLVWVEGTGLQRPVFALLKDRDGDLWIGTDNGVHRRRGREMRHFGLAAGLIGRESNRDALLQDRHGIVWIGTNLGVSAFNPALERPLPRPQVHLEFVSVGDRRLDPGQDLLLPHDEGSPVFSIHASTFGDAKRLQVQGRLVGFEETFEDLGPGRHEARYTQLAPGTYRYELRTRWFGGAWESAEGSGTLTVARPWWGTRAFYGLATLLAAALVGAVVWVVFNYRYSRQLAGKVAERTSELEHLTRRLQAEIEQHRRTETELRLASSAAEQASRAKSSFLATMSHEIRTPMNGVLGIAYLLERGELSADQRRRVAALRHSGEALLEILDDILDYSKIEAGALELSLHPFDLPNLLHEAVDLFESRAAEKGIELRRVLADDLPRRVLGDSSRVRQVLINLVGNAIKFTDRGHVVVEAESRPGRRLNVALRVRDTGIGIPKELQWQLFQPFHQLESGHHRRHGGTGLGLAISHHLITAMEGRIRVDSELGEGATFMLELSLPDATEAETQDILVAEVGPELAHHHPMRILLAEDNPINRMIALDMLAELGYQGVRTAENGRQALEALEAALGEAEGEEAIDLILMDLQMPELGGLEAARQVVERYGDRRPRMVALTAHAFQGDREACLRAGMDDHLPKPLSLERLAEALKTWSPQGPGGRGGSTATGESAPGSS